LIQTVGLALGTFHVLSNIRIRVEGDTAQLTC